MDAHHAAMIASMLGEIGIDVRQEDLAESESECETPTSPIYTCPPSPLERRPPSQLPSYEHLTHLQPERTRVPYKRATHFATHLAQITGNVDTAGLPKGIVRRLRRSGVKPLERGAYFRCRRLLKKWGYSSAEYRCVFAILKKMGGPVVRIPGYVEQRMKHDFDRLCGLFHQRTPLGSSRKNFISYYLIVQLLLSKYRIRSYYELPSIKDKAKFLSLIDAYKCIADCSA